MNETPEKSRTRQVNYRHYDRRMSVADYKELRKTYPKLRNKLKELYENESRLSLVLCELGIVHKFSAPIRMAITGPCMARVCRDNPGHKKAICEYVESSKPKPTRTEVLKFLSKLK